MITSPTFFAAAPEPRVAVARRVTAERRMPAKDDRRYAAVMPVPFAAAATAGLSVVSPAGVFSKIWSRPPRRSALVLRAAVCHGPSG